MNLWIYRQSRWNQIKCIKRQNVTQILKVIYINQLMGAWKGLVRDQRVAENNVFKFFFPMLFLVFGWKIIEKHLKATKKVKNAQHLIAGQNTQSSPQILSLKFCCQNLLFPSSFFLRASRSSTLKEKLAAAGFNPSTFRSKVDDLDHRTTENYLIAIG